MSATTSGCIPRRVRQCRARACARGLEGVGQEGRGRVTARESMGARAQHDGWKAKESNRLRIEYHARARCGATHHPETDQSQHARHALRHAHSPPSTARTQVALFSRAKSGRGAHPFQKSPDIAAVARPSFLKPLEASAFRANGPVPASRRISADANPSPSGKLFLALAQKQEKRLSFFAFAERGRRPALRRKDDARPSRQAGGAEMLAGTYADRLGLQERQAGRRQPEGWQGQDAGKRDEEGWAFRAPGEAADSSTASCIDPRAQA